MWPRLSPAAKEVDLSLRVPVPAYHHVAYSGNVYGDADAGAAQAAAVGIVATFGFNGRAANTGAPDPCYIPRIMTMSDDDLATGAA